MAPRILRGARGCPRVAPACAILAAAIVLSACAQGVDPATEGMDPPSTTAANDDTSAPRSPSTSTTASTSTRPAPLPADCHDVHADLVARVTADLAAHGVPGASIAVVEEGHLRCASGIGVKRAGNADPVTPRTAFVVNSMTKVFTAAAAMALVEDGKLALERTLAETAPEVAIAAPYRASDVTLAMLLTHTAGVPTWLTDAGPGDGVDYRAPDALAEFFARHDVLHLWSPPGRVYGYSNLGYAVAGLAVERAAGEPYASFVTRRILRPAGMSDATFDAAAAMAGDHATGQTEARAPVEIDGATDVVGEPFAGLIANAVDLGRFLETVIADDGRVLRAASLEAMFAPHVDTGYPGVAYGYGMTVHDARTSGGGDGSAVRVLEHSGASTSFVSDMEIVTAKGFGVVVLANDGAYDGTSRVVDLAEDAVLGASFDPEPVRTPCSEWQAYAGSYEDPLVLGDVRVTFEDGKLAWSFPDEGGFTAELTQTSGAAFWAKAPPRVAALGLATIGVTFDPGPHGPAEFLVTHVGVAHRAK